MNYVHFGDVNSAIRKEPQGGGKTAGKVKDPKGQEMRWAAGDSLTHCVWNLLIREGRRDQEI